MPLKGRVLVLAPHPDDETIGCGGTLALHYKQGDKIKVIFATDGQAGDYSGYYSKYNYTKLRQSEAKKAAKILGIDSIEFWDYPDGKLPKVKGLAKRLLTLLEREQPDIVYHPAPTDPHPDHKYLAKQCQKALRWHTSAIIDCCYEVTAMIRPTHVVDISRVWDHKLWALKQYRSQLRYCDYTRLISKVNLYRSLFLQHSQYAEAYAVTTIGDPHWAL